ncbi:hypothetical protein KKG05_05670 [bacterium]|nr:hypothetical protein [bacterium]
MLIRWVLLVGLFAGLVGFAEENIDAITPSPISSGKPDSLSSKLSAYIDTPAPKKQTELIEWLRAGLLSEKPVRVVIDGMFEEDVPAPPSEEEIEEGTLIPWDSSAVLYSENQEQADSFLVHASMTGCPGINAKPSVSVAFPTPYGWSCPPIRFGPVVSNCVCPLDVDVQLEILKREDAGPVVRIMRGEDVYSSR